MTPRTGSGRIYTADQLAEKMTIPAYYILERRATPVFPNTCTPRPATFVQIIRVKGLIASKHSSSFPVRINGKQWEEVMVPILTDERWIHYLGRLGDVSSQSNYGIPETKIGSGLFGSFEDGFLDLLKEEIRSKAIEAGYGSPEQIVG